jgi:hypothetical protein
MRRQLAAAALFLGLAVVELWTPIAHGGFYMASDLGQLWPITHSAAGPAQPANSLESDVYSQLMPFMHFTVAQVRAGNLPTWNPYNGNGQPFFANAQSSVLSPFTIFFYTLSFRLALIASALARLWLIGFFTFMFLRRHRLGDLASLVGATIFMFAGYHLVWLNYPITSVSAWLPLSLWCARVALDHREGGWAGNRPRNLATGGLTLAVAAMLLGGNPETATFDILLIVAYILGALAVERVGWRTSGQYVARFVVAGALSAGLAAAQLIPFLRYERISTAAQTHVTSIPGFNLSTVPIMAFPNLFGGPQFSYDDGDFYLQYLHPQTNYAELDGNVVGLIALGLAPVGLVALRRRRREVLPWFGLGSAVVGTLLLYSHAMGAVWEHVPLLHTAYLNRSQDVELLGLAVLAALGTDWVVRAGADWRQQARHARVALLVLVGSVLVVSAILTEWGRVLRAHVARIVGSPTATSAALRFVHRQTYLELALMAGFVAALCGFALLRRSLTLRIGLAAAVMAAVFGSTGLIMRSYNPTVPASLSYPVTPDVQQLKSIVGNGEVLFADNSFGPPATGLWFGIHDVGSYDSIGLRWHDELYRRVFHTPDTRMERLPSCLEGLQLFGVKWVVGGNGTFGDGTALAPTGSIGGIPYYAVPASPTSLLVADSRAVPRDAKALPMVSGCDFDSARQVVVDADSSGGGAAAPGNEATAVTATVHSNNTSPSSVVETTSSSEAGWLVVKEAWAPGWRATVDGRSEPVQRVDMAFLGVHLGPGRHVIRFSYS